MKDGDKIVEQFRELVRQRDLAWGLVRALACGEYLPGWVYWLDWLRSVKN